jgi:hypothetical protein
MLTATPLNSSMLKCASYDSTTQTLVLEYNKGNDIWYYSRVPFHVFEGLLAAESAGKYFLSDIKGKYEGRKVAPGTPFVARFEMVDFAEPPRDDLQPIPLTHLPLSSEVDEAFQPAEMFQYPTQLPDQKAERPW